MEAKKIVLVLCVLLPSCAEITVNIPGDFNTVTIEQPKTVSTYPSVTASGNTVPIAP